MSSYTIRRCESGDLPSVASLYAHFVLTSTATFELDPPSFSEMESRHQTVLSQGLPWLVAVCDGDVVGFAYAQHYRARPAYRFCVEDSVYVSPSAQGKGIGVALLSALIEHATASGCRQMVAVIGDSANAASQALHKKVGFEHAGAFRNSGWKFDRWLDTVFMQRSLGEGSHTSPVD